MKQYFFKILKTERGDETMVTEKSESKEMLSNEQEFRSTDVSKVTQKVKIEDGKSTPMGKETIKI